MNKRFSEQNLLPVLVPTTSDYELFPTSERCKPTYTQSSSSSGNTSVVSIVLTGIFGSRRRKDKKSSKTQQNSDSLARYKSSASNSNMLDASEEIIFTSPTETVKSADQVFVTKHQLERGDSKSRHLTFPQMSPKHTKTLPSPVEEKKFSHRDSLDKESEEVPFFSQHPNHTKRLSQQLLLNEKKVTNSPFRNATSANTPTSPFEDNQHKKLSFQPRIVFPASPVVPGESSIKGPVGSPFEQKKSTTRLRLNRNMFPNIDEFAEEERKEEEEAVMRKKRQRSPIPSDDSEESSERPTETKKSSSKFLEKIREKSRNYPVVPEHQESSAEILEKTAKLRTKLTESSKILDIAIETSKIDPMLEQMSNFTFGKQDCSFGQLPQNILREVTIDFLRSTDIAKMNVGDFFAKLGYSHTDSKTDNRMMRDALSTWTHATKDFPPKYHDHHALLAEKKRFKACLEILLKIDEEVKQFDHL